MEFERVQFDEPGDGSIWAHGQTYKAEFDDLGATFVPYFGSHAPRNFPIAVTLDSIRVAGERMEFTAPADLRRDANRVTLARGNVLELYDLDTLGIEQSFVFSSLPSAGDLNLRLAVATDLEARTTDDGIEFSNELGFVRYGKATVLDASGASLELETTWTGTGIEIAVPADFLANARFPVTIDPIFSTFAVDVSAEADSSPDIAFDHTGFTFAVTWERAFSAADHDVWIEEWNEFGIPVVGSRMAIDFTGTSWAHPRIASNRLAGQFLVVAQAGDAPARIIRGRTMESEAPQTMGAQFTISGIESGDKFDPDVGGDPEFVAPTYYCVVWTRDYSATDWDVHARIVSSTSTLIGTTILVDNTAAFDLGPSISKSNGPAPAARQDWNIVWAREVGTGTNGDIHGAQIHWDGVVTTPSFPIWTGSSNSLSPSASPGIDILGSRRYLVSFAEDNGIDSDVFAGVLTGSTITSAPASLSFMEGQGAALEQVQPHCEASDQLFHVAYSEWGTTSIERIRATALYFTGTALLVAESRLNVGSGTYVNSPRITSRRSGGSPGSDKLGLAWADPTGAGDIRGAIVTTPIGGHILQYCPGDGSTFPACPCGNNAPSGLMVGCLNSLGSGGALAGTGNASIGSDSLQLLGSGMPNSSALYFQGTTGVSGFPLLMAFGDGLRCVTGSFVRLGTKNNAGNASQYPTGGDLSIGVKGMNSAGTLRFYQCWYRNAATFCTTSTFNLTNGLRVTWLP